RVQTAHDPPASPVPMLGQRARTRMPARAASEPDRPSIRGGNRRDRDQLVSPVERIRARNDTPATNREDQAHEDRNHPHISPYAPSTPADCSLRPALLGRRKGLRNQLAAHQRQLLREAFMLALLRGELLAAEPYRSRFDAGVRVPLGAAP